MIAVKFTDCEINLQDSDDISVVEQDYVVGRVISGLGLVEKLA